MPRSNLLQACLCPSKATVQLGAHNFLPSSVGGQGGISGQFRGLRGFYDSGFVSIGPGKGAPQQVAAGRSD